MIRRFFCQAIIGTRCTSITAILSRVLHFKRKKRFFKANEAQTHRQTTNAWPQDIALRQRDVTKLSLVANDFRQMRLPSAHNRHSLHSLDVTQYQRQANSSLHSSKLTCTTARSLALRYLVVLDSYIAENGNIGAFLVRQPFHYQAFPS